MNIVVTGGGTVAPIDDVRQITNVSTGRFSSEISEAFLRKGAKVVHIHAPGALLPFDRSAKLNLTVDSPDHEVRRLLALKDEYQALRDRLTLRPIGPGTVHNYSDTLKRELAAHSVDAVVLAMAVSDYEPDPIRGKLSSDHSELFLTLRRTPKVIQMVRDWAPNAIIVGFKLLSGSTTEQLIETARKGCIANRTDLTVANDLKTIQAGQHTIHLVDSMGLRQTIGPDGPIASILVDRLVEAVTHRPALEH